MKKEIDKAVETFHRIAFGTGKKGRQTISDKQLASFVTVLTELLLARYKNSWHPENPDRGSGYRCLRMNAQCVDPVIRKSLDRSKIKLNKAQQAMELTVWVDPGIVSFRIGEDGSIGNEYVEMDFRRDSTSEDEAYVSRSPSPVSLPPSNVTPSKRDVSVSTGSPQVISGPVYQQRISPPSMSSNSGLLPSKIRPLTHHPVPNSQELMPSGYIPAPQPQSSYSRPKALFPPPQEMNANGSNFPGHYREGMMPSHHHHATMAAMRMPRSMHYMDIPAQA